MADCVSLPGGRGNEPWSAFLGYFSSVLDRISFIFDPNIKIKKRKFAHFSDLYFVIGQNFLAPFVKNLKLFKWHHRRSQNDQTW